MYFLKAQLTLMWLQRQHEQAKELHAKAKRHGWKHRVKIEHKEVQRLEQCITLQKSVVEQKKAAQAAEQAKWIERLS
jgi:hypothetical protein